MCVGGGGGGGGTLVYGSELFKMTLKPIRS